MLRDNVKLCYSLLMKQFFNRSSATAEMATGGIASTPVS